ncbi:MAG: hypothetical protein OK456_11365, partial [Thaumarchaeota archaeon]|nr:hypothetical protein [Nitrososphaerota archaeon]
MEWTNLIQSTIRTQCGEHIEFRGVIGDDGTFRIDYDRSPDSLPCVLKAIRENIAVMHPVARSIFEKIIEDFEKPPAQGANKE